MLELPEITPTLHWQIRKVLEQGFKGKRRIDCELTFSPEGILIENQTHIVWDSLGLGFLPSWLKLKFVSQRKESLGLK
jgi:hypothetical protein